MFSPLAAGRKVYGNGSYAPNRGRLNPAGYIKRELAKRGGVSQYGKDGASDTRSGIAAAALRKNVGAGQGSPITGRLGPGGRPIGRPVQSPMGNHPAMGMNQKTTHVTTTKPATTTSATGKKTTSPQTSTSTKVEVAPPAPAVPQVKINNDGTLELPYNPEYADNVLTAQQTYQQNQMKNQQDTQNENISYQTTLRDGQYAYQDQRRGTLNENASGGTAFSSKYGAQVGDNARVYNNALNDLNSTHNLNQQRLTAERGNNQNTLNQYLQSLALQYGVSLSGDAGKLGLGGEKPKPGNSAPIPKVPGKPKPSKPSKPVHNPMGTKKHPHGGRPVTKHHTKKHPSKTPHWVPKPTKPKGKR